ncbi:AraC family transcriptional regulator [Cupriavidus basilensis]|uniref:AraC family transcriptional regulator n=1 Tax=Cupriavidus basilensis TaxID=68895 RepID=A0ABT6ASM9_9BURK|nr:AraC family transcriptional regulator [Cupriavidus basilensis]MDF3834701.1 AraC family transcriptional regulator [Cupriavidus basilensis]
MPRANAAASAAAITAIAPASCFAETGGTVSLPYLRTVLDYGEAAGIAPADQLAMAGLDPALLDGAGGPAARVRAASYLALLDGLAHAAGDALAGLHAGARFRPRHYAEMGYVVLTTPTVREAILQGIRYEVLANDIGRTRLHETAQGAWMTWEALHGPLSRHAHELHMATWICFARWLLGDGHFAERIEFPHAPPPGGHADEYAQVFGCPVVFNAPRHAMHIAPALLARPSMQADAQMQAQMARIAQAQLRALEAGGTGEIAQARAFIGGALHRGEVPIAAVAAHLRLPVRTLQRRLQAQGLSYSALVDGVRRLKAEHYLADPAISLAQLAMLLGFSEQSAFSHAFKRWTQETPNAWRRRLLGGARG